jgi:hypothetical protein
MRYLIWIPIAILYNFLVCLIAVKVGNKDFWKNYLLITAAGFIPTWSLAAYYSKNLIFDGMLFDTLLVISGVVIFALLGQAETFTWLNWIGVIMVLAGLVLTRWQ